MTSFKANHIHRSFSTHSILKGVSISAEDGDIIEISGKNGSGKTTLLRILAGVLTADSGSISLNGQELKGNTARAFVPCHDGGLFSRMTGLENIHFFANLIKADPSTLEKRIKTWTKETFFSEALKTPFYQCSTGMKKFLLSFILTMHSPELILLDEPFASLHKDASVKLIEMLKEENPKRIFIFSNHQTELSLPYSKKTYLLEGGQLVH